MYNVLHGTADCRSLVGQGRAAVYSKGLVVGAQGAVVSDEAELQRRRERPRLHEWGVALQTWGEGERIVMTYVIAEPCINVKDASCVAVCPVDCIYSSEADNMYYINPDECIDCGACEPECPVNAIFAEDEVPAEWTRFTQVNADYFKK